MSGEIPLQYDLFTRALVDARTPAQRQQEREHRQPAQISMFTATQHLELSTPARPWLSTLPAPRLTLEIQDTRSDEEKERAALREAQKLTVPMFAEIPQHKSASSVPLSNKTGISILPLSRTDLLKIRPDLEAKIHTLSDAEVEFLIKKIEQAFEDVYKMLVNVVLAVHFDNGAPSQPLVKSQPESNPSTP